MSEPSHIHEQQNEGEQLRLLAAVSEAYARAKRVMAVQMFLTIPTAVTCAILLIWFPSAKIWTTFFFTTIALIDILVLNPLQNALKRKGACLQQMFDSRLFNLPWSALRCGSELDQEEILRFSEKRLSSQEWVERHRNWYPPIAGEVPLEFGRLICQRSTLRWDRDLRKHYRTGLVFMLIALVVTVFLLALLRKNSVEEMILTVYVPLAPAIIWIIREVIGQGEAASRSEKLFDYAKAIWNRAVSHQLDSSELMKESLQIQDALFDSRSKNPMIFNWVNSLLRPQFEKEMHFSAEKLVGDVKGGKAIERAKNHRLPSESVNVKAV